MSAVERKLREISAEPLINATSLNTAAEWWRVPGRFPFTVPIELDG